MKTTFLKISSALIMLSAFLLFGCKKTETTTGATPIDSSQVSVQYSPTLNLAGYKTIAVSDSVLSVDTASTYINELNSTEAIYLQTLKDSLAARGFSIVPLSSHPDLVLNATRITFTANGSIDSTNYWNRYSTFYNQGLYGDSTATYHNTFSIFNTVGTGVLSFELLDVKNTATTHQINIIWNGQVAGSQLYSSPTQAAEVVGILMHKSPTLFPS